MRKILLAATAVAALAIAGCGSSSNTTSSNNPYRSAPATSTKTAASTSTTPAASTGATTVAISANPGGMLMFTTNKLTAKAGKVTIVFTNKSPLGHNFTLATSSGTVLGATPTFSGGTKTLTVSLKAGTYTYYCSVPGHRAAGMQGTLTVS